MRIRRATLALKWIVVLAAMAAALLVPTASFAAEAVLIYISEGYGIEGDVDDPFPNFVELKASLSAPSTLPVSFSYSTPTNACFSVNGTCAYPVFDFVDSAGTVVFAPGETTKSFVVPIVPDSYVEPKEGFPVDLWAPVNAAFDPRNSGGWTSLVGYTLEWFLGVEEGHAVDGLSGIAWGYIGDDDRANVDGTPPTQPTGLTAQALAGQKIKLSWKASTDSGSGLSGYRVERSSSGSPFTVIVTTTTTSYTDSGLTKGKTYTYRVVACDKSDNCSAPSNNASATAA